METSNFCEKIVTIPQFGGTCWFNAILMATIYSQNSRKLLLKIYKDWDTDNMFLMIIRELLLYNYVFTDKTKIFLNKFKPEVIILYMLNYFKNDVLKQHFKAVIKNTAYDNISWNSHFINKMYKYLGVKCLDITYREDTKDFLFNVNKKINYETDGDKIFYSSKFSKDDLDYNKDIEENKKILEDTSPDVLIFTHSKLSEVYISNINSVIANLNKQSGNKFKDVYNLAKYKPFDSAEGLKELDGLKKYQDEIFFNGSKYKLESCLLNNYNTLEEDEYLTHLITGITCKNERYIYNGWDKNLSKRELKQKKYNTACPLLKYKWDLHDTKSKSFCFNTEKCNIDVVKDEETFHKNDDLCFSFNKFYRSGGILIYIKDESEKDKSIDINNIKESKSLSLNSDFSKIVKNMHEIKKLSREELINQIKILNEELDINPSLTINELQKILYEEISNYFNIEIKSSPELIGKRERSSSSSLSPSFFLMSSSEQEKYTKIAKKGGVKNKKNLKHY
jgi:hypothetical protein